MLKIEETVTMSPAQLEIVIKGMRNPKNSWDRIDSYTTHIEDPDTHETADYAFFWGDKDMTLAENLVSGGPVHAKFRRMLVVWVTLDAPFYWWKEFDTYKVGTVANSCSTMHKIHAKEFVEEDFSFDQLTGTSKNLMFKLIDLLNECRQNFIETKNKLWWWQMIQMLPTSYNQKRTVLLNYEVLANMYKWRKNHKLDEWHTFCEWIESLPYAEELIIGGKEN